MFVGVDAYIDPQNAIAKLHTPSANAHNAL